MLQKALLLSSLVALSQQATLPRAVDNDNLPPLVFNENGTFQISIFADLHFGEGELPSTDSMERRNH